MPGSTSAACRSRFSSPTTGTVRLGDLISLTFCAGWTDDQHFGDETIRLSGTQVVVSPDLFGGIKIPIAITAKELRPQRFESDASLRHAVRAANTIELRGEVSGAPSG